MSSEVATAATGATTAALEEPSGGSNTTSTTSTTSTSSTTGAAATAWLRALCDYYAAFLLFPSLHDRHHALLAASTERLVAQLDELATVVDGARTAGDTTSAILPALLRHARQLRRTYTLIERLEEFVARVAAGATSLERRVAAAEKDAGITDIGVALKGAGDTGLRVFRGLGESVMRRELPSLQRLVAASEAPPLSEDDWRNPADTLATADFFSALRDELQGE